MVVLSPSGWRGLPGGSKTCSCHEFFTHLPLMPNEGEKDRTRGKEEMARQAILAFCIKQN